MRERRFSFSEKAENAILKIASDFPGLNWNFRPDPSSGDNELISQWLGEPSEDIMVCIFKGKHIAEKFHRQDFFFFNFAYKGAYRTQSAKFKEFTEIAENECYIGQPFSGYALTYDGNEDVIIFGVLIKKEVFLKEFLSAISRNPSLLHFFLEPEKNRFSEEFIHLSFGNDAEYVRNLLAMMALEYAEKDDFTQEILMPLALSLFMLVARRYEKEKKDSQDKKAFPLIGQILNYINSRSEKVSLDDLARDFLYHRNYISALIHKETGKKFSEIVLEARMRKASLLLKNTDLPVENIASLVGYTDSSNFYKAYKNYFHSTPREKNPRPC